MNILLKGQLGFMNRFFDVSGVTSYDQKHFNEVVAREGVAMKAIEMKRTIAPVQDLVSLWKLYRHIKKLKPYIVHTHTPKAGLIGMLAARLASVPVRLHTVAGMPLIETTGAKRMLLNIIERLTYSCAHRVYPNSNGLATIIRENNFCSPKKLKIIAGGSSNGINTAHFSPSLDVSQKMEFRSRLGISKDAVLYCFVGRLCTEKGIRELVEAFIQLQLRHENADVKLLLVGPFEKENGELPAQAVQQIENTPNIVSVGRHDDIRPYLEISDVFVFPSYREGFPNVVLQAGAMELPCIVSDINGCNEIIIQNYNGLIVPVKNTERLLDEMEQLLLSSALRRKLASVARKNVQEKYDQQMIWEALLAEYQSWVPKSVDKIQ
jgi:glycosyltransferase involved in cell wall biosynthesis